MQRKITIMSLGRGTPVTKAKMLRIRKIERWSIPDILGICKTKKLRLSHVGKLEKTSLILVCKYQIVSRMYVSLLSHNAGKRDLTFSDLGVIMQVCRLEGSLSKIRNAK